MPAAELSAAITSLRALIGIGTAAFNLKTDADVAAKVFDIQRAAGEALAALMEAREEKSELQDRVRALEAEVEKLQRARDDLDRYELLEISPGVPAYRKKDGSESGLLLCSACFQKGEKSYLSLAVKGYEADLHKCPRCQGEFKQRLANPRPRPKLLSGKPGSWMG